MLQALCKPVAPICDDSRRRLFDSELPDAKLLQADVVGPLLLPSVSVR